MISDEINHVTEAQAASCNNDDEAQLMAIVKAGITKHHERLTPAKQVTPQPDPNTTIAWG